ncbi:MAG: NAD(P)/FAD-dependent oxidoreductase, partial [Actinomycetota bacterium]
MTSLPDRARVVVVGVGITGTSVAYHLTELGWRDVVVLDRGPFPRTGSSTSHAPGLMFLHNNSQIMARLAQYSADLYESFEWEDLPGYYRVGGVEVATNPARLEELKRKAGQMRSWGGDAWMLSPEEAQKHVPMLDPSKILGAVFFPKDGVTRAVRTVSALADKASSQGASFHGEQEVTGFDITDGRVHGVRTADGTIECEAVVLASGYWGPRVGALAGVSVPLRPFQHQYTKTVPLERYRGAAECVEPILRYQDMDMYFRQDGEVYGLGSYWHEPRMLEPSDVPTKAFSENGVSVLPFQDDDWAV